MRRTNSAARSQTECTHGTAKIASPAKVSPTIPLMRRPHLRLCQRRLIQSESTPPARHDTIPAASGKPASHDVAAGESCRLTFK